MTGGVRSEALARLASVDARDSYTGGHSRRVRSLAVAIGQELGLAELELSALGHAALFHDIGKLAIPDEVLLKPAALTEEEWELMRSHSILGASMVEDAGLAEPAIPAIRHHHERYDGTGYPDGLAGESIPLAARIVHLADAVDSMLTTRVYRAGRPARAAVAEVRQEAGAQFCPSCSQALLALVARGELEELGLPARALVTAVA